KNEPSERNWTPSTSRSPNLTTWRICWRMPHSMRLAFTGTIEGNGGNDVADEKSQIDEIPKEHAELKRILKLAAKGDTSILPVLKKMLESGCFTESVGNLAARIQETIIDGAAGTDLLAKGAMSRKLEQLRNELTTEDTSPLERLLIDRVVLCWLSLHETE